MNIINVSVAELIEQQQPEYCVVPIGNQGEHGVIRILFDCTQFVSLYGEGIAQLLHQRNGDGIPYIATVSQEGNAITWDISGDDTARDGFGKLQLNWYVSGNLAKSCVLRTMVKKALTDATLIPEEVKSDLELLTEAVASKNPLLRAGNNINIEENTDGTQTISSTGGGGGSTYTAGDGIDISNNEISVKKDNNTLKFTNGVLGVDFTTWEVDENLDPSFPLTPLDPSKAVDANYIATAVNALGGKVGNALALKQNQLTAGENIEISIAGIISATDTTYSAGTGISIVNDVISATLGINIEVVQTLPQTGEAQTIYLVPKQGSTGDVYDEFIWVNNAYEKIGSTEVDLSNYYTKSQTDTLLASKADASTTHTKTEVDTLLGGKQDKTDDVTVSGTTLTIADNKVFKATNVTTLDIVLPANFSGKCEIVLTTADTGYVGVNAPTNALYPNGEEPTIGAGETWELNVFDNRITYQKFEVAS